MTIYQSRNYDPYWNLALEDHLLDLLPDYGRLLLLWQADHTVVLGKNQNPWKECRLDRLRADRGLLARRVSGGGAVYHDRGNLNYALFVPRSEYREETGYQLVRQALSSLGITAERMGKSSLAVGGRKVSGNAFCFRKNAVLHHGTLLVATNLDRLNRYLEVSEADIETRAIASVPAEVANLSEFEPGLTVARVAEALVHVGADLLKTEPVVRDPRELHAQALHDLRHRYVSWEWCYGHTPPFTISLPKEFPWGEVTLNLSVEKGHLSAVDVESSALDGGDAGSIIGELLDCPFKESSMARRIKNSIGRDGHALLEDISAWLAEQPLS
jgi:lipoate-protein ligase A